VKPEKSVAGAGMKPEKKHLNHKTTLLIMKIVVAVIGILMFALPAAAGRPQVEMDALVTVIGIDRTETGLRCTVGIVLPEEGGGTEDKTIVVPGEGRTLSTAFENIGISLGRKLELHHCALIVFGKAKAEEGVLNELEYLLSSGKVSPGIRLMLSGNKDAGEFVQKLTDYTKKMDTENLIKYLGHGSHNYSQKLVLFLSDIYSKSQTSVMPCFMMGDKAENMTAVEGNEAVENKKEEETEEKEEKGGGGDKKGGDGKSEGAGGGGGDNGESGGSEKEKPTVVQRAGKIGIFTQGKLKAVWERLPTNGLAWIDPETKYGVILLDDIKVKDAVITDLTCFLVKKDLKIKADFKEGVPVLKVKTSAQFQFEERGKLYAAVGDIQGDVSREIMPAIKKGIEKHITEDILSILEHSRRDGCDALMLHDRFYRYKHKEYLRYIESGGDLVDDCKVEFKYDITLN